jgi:hypothetical protein
MQIVLRPLSLGEVLDQTFRLYRKKFLLFVGIAAVPQIVVLAIKSSVILMTKSTSLGIAAVIVGAVGAIIGYIALLVANAVSQAAASVAVSEINLGRDVTISQAFGRVRGSFGRMTGIVFGLGMLIGLGFLCLIIPGIYLGLIWALAVPAAILEDLGFAECRDRSKSLTEGARGRMFVIFLLYWVIFLGLIFAFTMPMEAAKNSLLHGGSPLIGVVLSQLAASMATILALPVSMIAFTVAYYDQRVRKEGFDIQFMMESNAQASAAAAGAGTTPS